MEKGIDMMTRTARACRQDPARKSPSQHEHGLQVSCVRWFRMAYPAWGRLLFAVPNGGHRNKATAGKLKAEGATAGVADLILLRRNSRYGALLVEMKYGKGTQSEAQKDWQEAAEGAGYRYAVCRSLDDFIGTVEEYIHTD